MSLGICLQLIGWYKPVFRMGTVMGPDFFFYIIWRIIDLSIVLKVDSHEIILESQSRFLFQAESGGSQYFVSM